MKKTIVFVIVLLASFATMAQTPVTLSKEVQDFNGKRCYVHILQKGQTVHSIAQAYGNKYYEAIARKDVHLLKVGDTIWLPCKDQNTPITSGAVNTAKPAENAASNNYIIVASGQTLYSISRAYNVSIEDIKALNPEVAENGLKAGQKLLLPSKDQKGGSTTEKSAATTTKNNKAQASTMTETATVSTVDIRPRIDNNKVYVSLMMPLYLSQMDEISTTKFDVDQRGKKSYKSLEFIQFYEGVKIALDELENAGMQIVLNVVDVPGTTADDAEKAFTSHNVANSDVVIALLTKAPFERIATLCKQNKVFVVNPMSTRRDILDNPYVVKIMPSVAGEVSAMLTSIRSSYKDAMVSIVHSNGKEETAVRDEIVSQCDQMGINYQLLVWSADSKLTAAIKKNPSNVVINIYDQDKSRNRIQVSTLLNRLNALKSNNVVLYSIPDYTKEYGDVDFGQLQQLSYHTFNTDYDEDITAQQHFVKTFRNEFKTEPVGQYAGLGHDIITYFVTGLQEKGSDFWKDPQITNPTTMLTPVSLRQSAPGKGYENQAASIRRMGGYRFVQDSKNTIK